MPRFTAKHRLVGSHCFDRVFKFGIKKHLDGITIVALLNNETFPRLGFAISKKQINTAVQRNRIKRLARETFRQEAEHLSGIDFIVMVNKKCLNLNNQALREKLRRLLAMGSF